MGLGSFGSLLAFQNLCFPMVFHPGDPVNTAFVIVWYFLSFLSVVVNLLICSKSCVLCVIMCWALGAFFGGKINK